MIERESCGGVVVLRMANGKVNALDLEFLRALIDELDTLAAEGPSLVLTGRGRTFSAGVDLKRIVTESREYIEEYLGVLSAAFCTLFRYPGPAVAAVNGPAVAGGYVLAAACDYRVAAGDATRLGLSELQVGVPFPTAAIEIVRHAVGTPAARRFALSAELLNAPTALASGLVDEVVPAPALLERAVLHAAMRRDRGLAAYRLTKGQVQRPALERIERIAPDTDPLVRSIWMQPASIARIRSFLMRF